MKKVLLLLVSILCVSASAHAQSNVERIEFKGMEIKVERPRPEPDQGGARESEKSRQEPSRVKSPLEAAREERQRLLALIDDPIMGPAIANDPNLQQDHLNRLREAMAYVRMLEDKERSAAAATEAAARGEAAARERAARQAAARERQAERRCPGC